MKSLCCAGTLKEWKAFVACCTLVSQHCSIVYSCGVPVRDQWTGKGRTVGIHQVSICIMGPTRLGMTPSREWGRLRVVLRIVPGCHSVHMRARGSKCSTRGGCHMWPGGRDPKGGGGLSLAVQCHDARLVPAAPGPSSGARPLHTELHMGLGGCHARGAHAVRSFGCR